MLHYTVQKKTLKMIIITRALIHQKTKVLFISKQTSSIQ